MSDKHLLLLHGALGSQEQLLALKELLKDKFTVHTLNFRGHGGVSWGTEKFTIELFTEDALDYIEKHNLKQVSIFGYSMGGYVALNLARLHPQKVDKILTLATKFAWTAESSTQEVKMLNPAIIENKVPAFAKTLAERHAPLDWKEQMSKTAEMMLDLGHGGALTTADFGAINHAVLITVGSEDKMVSQEESQEVAAVLKNGQFEVLEAVQHPIEKVNLVDLAEKITNFL